MLVDQFIDRTFARAKSFFGTGCVAHVSMGHPVCVRLGDRLAAAAEAAGITMVRGGTYLVMEGPQFSTMAESNLYRSWGCDVIGMTNMPEAKLAREAEICYATIAMVTDFDCWHPDHDHVDGGADHIRAAGQRREGEGARSTGRAAHRRRPRLQAGLPYPCSTTRSSPRPMRATPRSSPALDAVAGRVLKRANPA